MKAGSLRHLITILAPPDPNDEATDRGTFGQVNDDWTTVAEDVWASVEPLAGRELARAQQIVASVTHMVTLWYREGIDEKQQVIHEGRTFEVAKAIDPQERHVTLELLCVESK